MTNADIFERLFTMYMKGDIEEFKQSHYTLYKVILMAMHMAKVQALEDLEKRTTQNG
jgi:hypothetical protein